LDPQTRLWPPQKILLQHIVYRLEAFEGNTRISPWEGTMELQEYATVPDNYLKLVVIGVLKDYNWQVFTRYFSGSKFGKLW
jgi:hypothetical protein